MHRRAVPILAAALCAALLTPAPAAAADSPSAREGQPLVFNVETIFGSYNPEPGTATEDVDFDGDEVTSTPGGQASVPTIDDEIYEPPETVVLEGPGGESGTGTITDDEPVLSVADTSIDESAGTGSVTVTASSTAAGPITFSLAGRDGTAGSAEYSVAAGGTIPAGQTSVAVPVTITNDADDELDETFSVDLAPTSANAGVADGEGVVTIVNDDLRILDISDVSTGEGTGSNSVARFTVRLNAPTFRTVSVGFVTVDGQATAPRDYLGRFGRVTFAPGQRTAVVDVGVIGDAQPEPSEAFAVRLADADGGRIGDGDAIGVVVDDDSGGPGTPPPAGDVTPPEIGLGAPKASGRRVTLRVSCPRGEKSCAGRVSLFTRPDRRSRARSLRRELRLGAKSFRLRGGGARTLSITVSAAVARAARRAGRLQVEAFAVTEDADGNVDTRQRRATLRYGSRRSR